MRNPDEFTTKRFLKEGWKKIMREDTSRNATMDTLHAQHINLNAVNPDVIEDITYVHGYMFAMMIKHMTYIWPKKKLLNPKCTDEYIENAYKLTKTMTSRAFVRLIKTYSTKEKTKK